jgi:uncharacterized membrane protein
LKTAQAVLVNNAFRSLFLNIWVVAFANLSQFVYMFLPGKQPMEYHLCTGTNPKEDSQDIKYHTVIYAVYTISIIANLCIPIKIAINNHKHKSMPNANKKLYNFRNSEFEYLTDLTTSVCIVLLMAAHLNTFVVAYKRDPDLLNAQPIRVYITQLFLPNFVGLAIMAVYFYRNKNLRDGLVRALQELFP